MVSDGQLIALMSHTIGSIGQVVKPMIDQSKPENQFIDMNNRLVEITRIYQGYIKQIAGKWKD